MKILLELKENLIISFTAIKANKMRSILTTLGIIIGIVSVTLMGTAIEGLNQSFTTSISAIGADVLYIQKFGWMMSMEDWARTRNRKDIKIESAKMIKEQSTYAKAVAPEVLTFRNIKFKNKTISNVKVIGTNDEYVETIGVVPIEGRFLSYNEGSGNRPICVIGNTIAENLFQNEYPLNKVIFIAGKAFRVIGVLEKQGKDLFGGFLSADNSAIIPIGTFYKSFGTRRNISIDVKLRDAKEIENAKEELRWIMRKSRKIPPSIKDDFAINQQELLVTSFNSISLAISAVGLFITGLSLLVGGVGIMNIMFVSVTERTKEIGIRKALGAKRNTILIQFLIESSIICLLGGILGIVIAFPLSILIDQMILPTSMPVSIIIIAIIVSVLVGLISGFLPAFKAAKLNPVEALRYE